jgi:hypothetical protein
MPSLHLPDGAVYEYGDNDNNTEVHNMTSNTRQATEARVGRELLKEKVEHAVGNAVAIAELERAAGQWEEKAADGAYTLAKEVRDYYADKARSARHEAAKLRGEDVAEPGPFARP